MFSVKQKIKSKVEERIIDLWLLKKLIALFVEPRILIEVIRELYAPESFQVISYGFVIKKPMSAPEIAEALNVFYRAHMTYSVKWQICYLNR